MVAVVVVVVVVVGGAETVVTVDENVYRVLYDDFYYEIRSESSRFDL